MQTNKLKEFWLTLSFDIEAQDSEQAFEIAKDLLAHGMAGSAWKVLAGEVSQVEEA